MILQSLTKIRTFLCFSVWAEIDITKSQVLSNDILNIIKSSQPVTEGLFHSDTFIWQTWSHTDRHPYPCSFPRINLDHSLIHSWYLWNGWKEDFIFRYKVAHRHVCPTSCRRTVSLDDNVGCIIIRCLLSCWHE